MYLDMTIYRYIVTSLIVSPLRNSQHLYLIFYYNDVHIEATMLIGNFTVLIDKTHYGKKTYAVFHFTVSRTI